MNNVANGSLESQLESQIELFVRSRNSTLGILRLVCHAMNEPWAFVITADSSSFPSLRVVPPKGVDAHDFMDGRVPEVFFGLLSVADDGSLVVEEFGGDAFSADWSCEASLSKALRELTWLGSPMFRDSKTVVTWRLLALEKSFTASGTCMGTNPQHVAHLTYDGLQATLFTYAQGSSVSLRDARLGVTVPQELDGLLGPIRAAGVRSGVLELGSGWREMGPMGLPSLTDSCRQVISRDGWVCDAPKNVEEAAKAQRKAELVRQALRLTARKEAVRNARRVFFAGQCLGTVPTSEQGLVAILHKLEAVDGVPIPVFKTLGWAGADGIDAIGDIQMTDVEPVTHDAAIEFEFMFRSFQTHQHPHQHVDLWFAGTKRVS